MSVHDTKISDFTNVLKAFYAKLVSIIPTKTSQLENDSNYVNNSLVGVSRSVNGATNIEYYYYDVDRKSTFSMMGADNLRNSLEDSTTEIAANMQKLDEKIPVEPVNNLLATVPGTALDAVQGKVLDDKIEEVSASLVNLGGFTPVIDETTGEITGYKTDVGGADTVFPFSRKEIIIPYIRRAEFKKYSGGVGATFYINPNGYKYFVLKEPIKAVTDTTKLTLTNCTSSDFKNFTVTDINSDCILYKQMYKENTTYPVEIYSYSK